MLIDIIFLRKQFWTNNEKCLIMAMAIVTYAGLMPA